MINNPGGKGKKEYLDIWQDILIDFEYKFNPKDGTATITAWKGTLDGEPSTKMVVPNFKQIIL